MIHFQNVSYFYAHAEQPVLDHVSLDIALGSFALVVGSSGAGKSTLVRCINGLVPHFSGGLLRGKIDVAGLDPIALGPEGMSHVVGCVFQEPESQAVMDVVEDEIAFALENRGMSRQDMRVRVEEVLDMLDLAELRHRKLSSLSGGEHQRVAIAAALALRPRILVLDEPTSQLDPQSAEDVLQALVRLNTDLELTIVLVEHRLERVLPFVDQIIYLPEGSSVLSGSPEDLLRQIPLTPPLVTVAKALGWSPLPLTIKAGLRYSRSMARPAQLTRAVSEAPPPAPAFLELRKVSAGYGGHIVLRNVSLGIAPGELVAMLGRNGAGKSTALKCMVGLLRPSHGQMLVAGRDSANDSVATICRLVGYVPQNPSALLFADSVQEELQITLRNHGIPESGQLGALLEQLQLTACARRYPRDLSVGERQRVAIGAIMVSEPQALLLDEPTRGLDYAAKQRLAELLRTWRRAGKAILLVTHDVEFVVEVADRVVILGRGELIADGKPADVLNSSPLFAPQVARLFPDTGWITTRDVLGVM